MSSSDYQHDALLETLKGLRILSTDPCPQKLQHLRKVLAQPESLTQIVALIKPSISKGKVQSSTVRQQKIQILCESLWTLNNLASEGSVDDVTEVLFLDHNITSILQMHLMENFIGENELQEQESVCHLSSQAASL